MIVLICIVSILVSLLLMHTGKKEGFSDDQNVDVNAETPLTPQQLSYTVLTSVMKPIRRLSSRLMDVGMWRERIEMAKMTPAELARRHLLSERK